MRKQVALSLLSFLASFAVCSQQTVICFVENKDTGEPIAYASVITKSEQGIMTDSLGKFSFTIRKQVKSNDSITISATGYASKRIAVRDLVNENKIKLFQTDITLSPIKIFASLKGDEKQFAYYREFHVDTLTWVQKIDSARYKRNYKGNGEIGYIFDMPARRFELNKVLVKINHNYDTCWLKLHLRDVGVSDAPLPEDELLKKQVILPVTLKYGLVEFDLNWKLIRIPTHQIYVGFELLRCGCSESTAPSFFFMGSEKGLNLYRENEDVPWKRGGEYTIYVRIMTK